MNFATTKQRILQFIEYKRITQASFLKETGIKRGFLDGDKLEGIVSDTFLAMIIATYPEINVEWLITGKGSMVKNYKTDTSATDIVSENNHYQAVDYASNNELRMKVIVFESENKHLKQMMDILKEQLVEKDKRIQLLEELHKKS